MSSTDTTVTCAHCQESKDVNEMFRCTHCKREHYCNELCSIQDWLLGHRETCTRTLRNAKSLRVLTPPTSTTASSSSSTITVQPGISDTAAAHIAALEDEMMDPDADPQILMDDGDDGDDDETKEENDFMAV